MKPVHPVLEKALPIYCEYLNSFQEEDNTHRYAPDQFTVWDPDKSLWGAWDTQGMVSGWYDVYHFTISNGDDGGDTGLIVFYEDETQEIYAMVQEFDTYLAMFYNQKKLDTPTN